MKTPKEKVNKIIELYKQGFKNKEIEKETGVLYETVKTIISREVYGGKPKPNYKMQVIEKMAHDRLTMSAKDVASKYGVSRNTVDNWLRDHPMRPRFMRAGVVEQKLQTGQAKLKDNEKIFKTRERGPQRAVKIHDNKNTIIFVDADDPREDFQIRDEYINKRKSSWN